MYCCPPWVKSPWNVTILPVGVNAAWMETSGQVITGDHWPTTAGLLVALLTVTDTVVEVPRLPAASRAWAVRLCGPSVVVVVFQLALYGAVVTSAPRLAPSTLNWTP